MSNAKRHNVMDSDLLALCDDWHASNQKALELYKNLDEVVEECSNAVPCIPPALFEKIRICGNLVEGPSVWPGPLEPWSRERLQRLIDREEGKPLSPSAEAKEHARKLIALIDERDEEVKRVMKPAVVAEAAADLANSVAWAAYELIAATSARTIEGLAAQARVMMSAGYSEHSNCETTERLARSIANNLQAVAALETPQAA